MNDTVHLSSKGSREKGRLASQRHREAQRERGIPEARRIDDAILAVVVGRVLGKGLHVSPEFVNRFVEVVVLEGGWNPKSEDVQAAVKRRIFTHRKRLRGPIKLTPAEVLNTERPPS